MFFNAKYNSVLYNHTRKKYMSIEIDGEPTMPLDHQYIKKDVDVPTHEQVSRVSEAMGISQQTALSLIIREALKDKYEN
jgi:hypothetical protein